MAKVTAKNFMYTMVNIATIYEKENKQGKKELEAALNKMCQLLRVDEFYRTRGHKDPRE